MHDFLETIRAAGVTREDSIVLVQLENDCNFVYFPIHFDLLDVLFYRSIYPDKPQFLKPRNIRTITALNLTAEALYPHHTMVILEDKEEKEFYAFGLFTELSIKMEKIVNANPFRFSTEYASFLFPKEYPAVYPDPIPRTRWIRFSRLQKSTSLTAVSELTMHNDKKIWNPIAVMSDRTAEILRMEILAMGADLTYEGDEGGYHFTEYNVDIETCQYVINQSSFLNPRAYSI